MAIDGAVHLDELRCIKESDDGSSEPYIWAAMLWMEWRGRETRVGVEAPSSSIGARPVMKGLSAGGSAAVPSAARRFSHRFPDRVLGGLGAVVVLLEQDELPFQSVKAGHERFVRELRRVLGGFISAQGRAPDPGEEAKLVAEIGRKVTASIKGSLSLAQKVMIGVGLVDRDDVLGQASIVTPVLTASGTSRFTLDFERRVTTESGGLNPSGAPRIPGRIIEVVKDHYRLEGRFVLR